MSTAHSANMRRRPWCSDRKVQSCRAIIDMGEEEAYGEDDAEAAEEAEEEEEEEEEEVEVEVSLR